MELGLIDELTYLVLDEVMASIDLIDAQFGPNASISLNVAAKQAGNTAFMLAFVQALAATNCSERFMIEVTEEAFLRRAHIQSDILPELRKLGSRVSIDDFGTGYFVALGTRRNHRRRDQDRPLLHHRYPQTSAQPGRAARHRIAQRGARHDRDRGRRGDLRGARLSASRHQDPVCPGLLLLKARVS